MWRQVGRDSTVGETKIHRCPGYPDALVGIPYEDEPEINTVPMALRRASLKFPKRDFLGERTRDATGKRGAEIGIATHRHGPKHCRWQALCRDRTGIGIGIGIATKRRR